MKLILNNDNELNLYEMPTRQSMFINGNSRDTIEFHFDKNKYSADEIFNIFANEKNTEKFKLVETSIVDGEEVKGSEYVYSNYCITNEMCLKNVILEKETHENEAVTETVISVTIGQLTYSEVQQKKVNEQMQELAEQNIMLMEAVAEIYESQLV